MRSGLFWGSVGGVRQLVELLTREVGGEPDLFLTGGSSASMAKFVSPTATHVELLNLAGIAVVAGGA